MFKLSISFPFPAVSDPPKELLTLHRDFQPVNNDPWMLTEQLKLLKWTPKGKRVHFRCCTASVGPSPAVPWETRWWCINSLANLAPVL